MENKCTCEEDYLLNILINGDSGVGKTSLLNRFVHNTFSFEYSTTFGIDRKAHWLENGKDLVVKMNVIATSGSERFRTICSSYYRKVHVVIMMFDTSDKESFDNIRTWYHEIERYGNEDEVIFLVGNNFHNANRVVTEEIAKALATELNVSYVEVSTYSGLNVDVLFTQCAQQTLNKLDPSIKLRIQRTIDREISDRAKKYLRRLTEIQSKLIKFAEPIDRSGLTDNTIDQLIVCLQNISDQPELIDLQKEAYSALSYQVDLIRDSLANVAKLFPPHKSPIISCLKGFLILFRQKVGITDNIHSDLKHCLDKFITAIYFNLSIDFDLSHISYAIDQFCNNIIIIKRFDLLSIVLRPLIYLEPKNDKLFVLAVFLHRRFKFEQYDDCKAIVCDLSKLENFPDLILLEENINTLTLTHYESIKNSVDLSCIVNVTERHTFKKSDSATEFDPKSVYQFILFLNEYYFVAHLLSESPSIIRGCILTLANFLTFCAKQTCPHDSFEKMVEELAILTLAKSMLYINHIRAMGEIVYWANTLDSCREYSLFVLTHLQNFLRLPIGPKESEDEYIERKAILLVISELDKTLDPRFEFNILVLMHVRKLTLNTRFSELTEEQKLSHVLILQSDFTLKQNEYLLLEIAKDLDNYLACVRIVHTLSVKYKLDFTTVAQRIMSVTTLYLNQYFEVPTHNKDESMYYCTESFRVATTFASLGFDIKHDIGESLVRGYFQMLSHGVGFGEPGGEIEKEILKIACELDDFTHLLNKLEKNEIFCLLTYFQELFIQRITEIIPAREETIERLISAAFESTLPDLYEEFTLILIVGLCETLEMRSNSEKIITKVFNHLRQDTKIDENKKKHYLFLMMEIRNIMLNVGRDQDEIGIPDFSDTFYLNYLALADALLLHDEYRAEVLDEINECMKLFSVPTQGNYSDTLFTELLRRGADPTANAPNTLVLALINSKNFERLNLLLNSSLNGITHIDLNRNCGQWNLIALALRCGAKADTIGLMLDCQFPLPKASLLRNFKGVNLEALALINEHLIALADGDPDDETKNEFK